MYVYLYIYIYMYIHITPINSHLKNKRWLALSPRIARLPT